MIQEDIILLNTKLKIFFESLGLSHEIQIDIQSYSESELSQYLLETINCLDLITRNLDNHNILGSDASIRIDGYGIKIPFHKIKIVADESYKLKILFQEYQSLMSEDETKIPTLVRADSRVSSTQIELLEIEHLYQLMNQELEKNIKSLNKALKKECKKEIELCKNKILEFSHIQPSEINAFLKTIHELIDLYTQISEKANFKISFSTISNLETFLESLHVKFAISNPEIFAHWQKEEILSDDATKEKLCLASKDALIKLTHNISNASILKAFESFKQSHTKVAQKLHQRIFFEIEELLRDSCIKYQMYGSESLENLKTIKDILTTFKSNQKASSQQKEYNWFMTVIDAMENAIENIESSREAQLLGVNYTGIE